MHTGDPADVPGVAVRAVPLLMTDAAATAEMARRALSWPGSALTEPAATGPPGDHAAPRRDHRAARSAGCPSSGPGDDLAAAIAAAAPWLADGDVLVVTSKVVSKVEGRLVPAPTDPDAAGRAAPAS